MKTQPEIEDYGTWDFDRLKTVPNDLESGDFESLGYLDHWLCKDPRIGQCIVDRGAAVMQNAVLEIEGGSPEQQATLRADFARCIPPDTVSDLLTWQRLNKAEFCQVIHDTLRGPILQPWNPAFLSRDAERTWWLREDAKTSILLPSGRGWNNKSPIEFGEDYLLLGTEIDPKPWSGIGAGWNILGPLCVGGVQALVWWLRNAMHSSISPLLVRTEGMDAKKDKPKFFRTMDEIGQKTWIEVPDGATEDCITRVQSTPFDYRSTAELKKEIDMIKAEYLKGQSTTTRLDSGSYNAVEVLINEVSVPMLALELARLAYSLNWWWIPLWRTFRQIPSSVVFELSWKVRSMKDMERRAKILMDLSTAVKNWPGCEADAKRILEASK